MTGNENRRSDPTAAGLVLTDEGEVWHQMVPYCYFCGGFVPAEGKVDLVTRTIWVCHLCRRNPACAVPGGEVARGADRVEAATLADLLALREELS